MEYRTYHNLFALFVNSEMDYEWKQLYRQTVYFIISPLKIRIGFEPVYSYSDFCDKLLPQSRFLIIIPIDTFLDVSLGVLVN